MNRKIAKDKNIKIMKLVQQLAESQQKSRLCDSLQEWNTSSKTNFENEQDHTYHPSISIMLLITLLFFSPEF